MTKRLLAAVVCLLLILAGGCEFFAAPSASPSPSAAPKGSAKPVASGPSDAAKATETVEPTETTTETTTESTTKSPTPATTPTPNPTEGMIFPGSDTELLKWEDLIVLDAAKLDLARNEIFARAGYKFTKEYYTDYYGKLSWYEVDPAFSTGKFSEIQSANITLIQVAEHAVKGTLFQIDSGTKLDYDQDGTLETLTYSAPDDYHMNVKIKDGSTTTTWNIDCEMPSKKAYLGDIDYDDEMLDLFVDENGPSDDYAAYVSGIKHHAFLNRTPTAPLPGTIAKMKPDGKGNIGTSRRMSILMTWFCDVKYKLDSSGKLAFVTQTSYSMKNFKCKTKVAIPLKTSASSSSPVNITVPPDTDVQLVSTDDVKWIQIKAPAGIGWLEMANATTLVNPNISGIDAFDGLTIAD